MVQQARRLHRSQDNRFLFGVAGGLAEYFDAEPVLIRVGWVLLTIATAGIAALAYIVMAIFTPDSERQQIEFTSEPSSDSRDGIVESDRPSKRHILRNMLGVGLIVAGMIILLGNLGVFGSIPWEIVWAGGDFAFGGDHPVAVHSTLKRDVEMAGAAGFEPATLGFGDRCSTSLSYAPAMQADDVSPDYTIFRPLLYNLRTGKQGLSIILTRTLFQKP